MSGEIREMVRKYIHLSKTTHKKEGQASSGGKNLKKGGLKLRNKNGIADGRFLKSKMSIGRLILFEKEIAKKNQKGWGKDRSGGIKSHNRAKHIWINETQIAAFSNCWQRKPTKKSESKRRQFLGTWSFPTSFARVAQQPPPSYFTWRPGRSGVAAEGEKEADGPHRLDHRGRQDVRAGLLLALV